MGIHSPTTNQVLISHHSSKSAQTGISDHSASVLSSGSHASSFVSEPTRANIEQDTALRGLAIFTGHHISPHTISPDLHHDLCLKQ